MQASLVQKVKKVEMNHRCHMRLVLGTIGLSAILYAFGHSDPWQASTGSNPRIAHESLIYGLAFHPSGRMLASGSLDKTVKLWDVSTGLQLRTLRGHSDGVYKIAFNRTGRMLASASRDQTVKLWDVASGGEMRTLSGHSHAVKSVAFSQTSDLLASASNDGTVKLWDVSSGQALRTLEHTTVAGGDRSVYSVAFSPDGRWLGAGNGDGTVSIWETAFGRELRVLSGHQGPVWAVCFTSDSRWMASASWDNSVRIWDMNSGRELRAIVGSKTAGLDERVLTAAVSQDGRWLAYSQLGADPAARTYAYSKVKLWHIPTAVDLRTLTGHATEVFALAFSPDSRTLASTGEDKTIRLWDVSTGGELRSFISSGR